MTLRAHALLKEVVAALAGYQHLRVSPEVEHDAKEDGLVTVSVTFRPTTEKESLEVLELAQEVQYLSDAATVRGFVSTYGFDATAFDGVLLQRGDQDATVLKLSNGEREALDLLIASSCALDGPIPMSRVDLRQTLLGIRGQLTNGRRHEQ